MKFFYQNYIFHASALMLVLVFGATNLQAAKRKADEKEQSGKRAKIDKEEKKEAKDAKTIDCPICLNEGVESYIKLSCGHEFCHDCIIEWYTDRENIIIEKTAVGADIPGGIYPTAQLSVKNYDSCSLCRTKLSDENIRDLKNLIGFKKGNWKEQLRTKMLIDLEKEVVTFTPLQKKLLLQACDGSYQHYDDAHIAHIDSKEIARIVFAAKTKDKSPTFSDVAQALEESAFLAEAYEPRAEDKELLAVLKASRNFEASLAERAKLIAQVASALKVDPSVAEIAIHESLAATFDYNDKDLTEIAFSLGLNLAEYKKLKNIYLLHAS